jgi:hypothetical protein
VIQEAYTRRIAVLDSEPPSAVAARVLTRISESEHLVSTRGRPNAASNAQLDAALQQQRQQQQQQQQQQQSQSLDATVFAAAADAGRASTRSAAADGGLLLPDVVALALAAPLAPARLPALGGLTFEQRLQRICEALPLSPLRPQALARAINDAYFTLHAAAAPLALAPFATRATTTSSNPGALTVAMALDVAAPRMSVLELYHGSSAGVHDLTVPFAARAGEALASAAAAAAAADGLFAAATAATAETLIAAAQEREAAGDKAGAAAARADIAYELRRQRMLEEEQQKQKQQPQEQQQQRQSAIVSACGPASAAALLSSLPAGAPPTVILLPRGARAAAPVAAALLLDAARRHPGVRATRLVAAVGARRKAALAATAAAAAAAAEAARAAAPGAEARAVLEQALRGVGSLAPTGADGAAAAAAVAAPAASASAAAEAEAAAAAEAAGCAEPAELKLEDVLAVRLAPTPATRGEGRNGAGREAEMPPSVLLLEVDGDSAACARAARSLLNSSFSPDAVPGAAPATAVGAAAAVAGRVQWATPDPAAAMLPSLPLVAALASAVVDVSAPGLASGMSSSLGVTSVVVPAARPEFLFAAAFARALGLPIRIVVACEAGCAEAAAVGSVLRDGALPAPAQGGWTPPLGAEAALEQLIFLESELLEVR